jgi:ABC-type molybdate transport system substrate-binding protein
MVMPKILLLALLVAFAGCGKKAASSTDPIKVAAASDLAFAFKEVGAAFESKTGRKVTFTFGSTGQLAKQISEGAPYDVFAAANVTFVDEVVKARRATAPRRRCTRAAGSNVDEEVAAAAALSDLTKPGS